MEDTSYPDRWSGLLLVTFVIVQIVYLVFNAGVSSAPSPDAPLVAWRRVIQDHSGILRASSIVPPVNFVCLLVPGAFALRRRLLRAAGGGGVLPDLSVAGVLLITVTVFIGAITYAVLGLVPTRQLSDSVLRVILIANTFDIFGVGQFAVALFVGAVSAALLVPESPAGWLGWWGAVTAALSIAGALWAFSASFNGPFFTAGLVARVSFLAWILATGIWMLRTAVGERLGRDELMPRDSGHQAARGREREE